MSPLKSSSILGFVFWLTLLAISAEGLRPGPRIETDSKQANLVQSNGENQIKGGGGKLDDQQQQQQQQQQVDQNEIDDRIRLGEPYKSLLQTTARFALVQTNIANHVNMDTAMNIINDAGFMLAKPSNLYRAMKAVAVSIATFLATTILFPGAYRTLDAIWQDPVKALHLDRYMDHKISERSIFGLLSSTTDDALSRVGLQDYSCRERSACYIGEIIKCSFPETSDRITKFTSEHFTKSHFKDNKYMKAFSYGFVDGNCTIYSENTVESPNCLGNFINSVLSPRLSRPTKITKD